MTGSVAAVAPTAGLLAGGLQALAGWLAEPFQYHFMRHALAAVVLIGLAGGLVGSFTVVRGTAFFADALAHAVVPGVAVAYLWRGMSAEALFWGALVAAVGASVAIWAAPREHRVREETAIGVVMAAALALGVALVATRRGYAVDLAHLLFGHVLGVGPQDVQRAAGLAAVLVGTTLLLWRPLTLVAFDPVLAATVGLPVRLLELVMLLLTAATTVLALQTVGATMTLALLVVPAAAARLVAVRMAGMAAAAVLLAVGASVGGLYLSYYTPVPSGPAIVLVATAIFVVLRVGVALRKR